MTGQTTNNQRIGKSFFFDCADPSVNFTDGTYTTNLVLKNKSFIPANSYTAVPIVPQKLAAIYTKIYQDVSAYPNTIELQILSGSTLLVDIFLPYANVPGAFSLHDTVAEMLTVQNPLNEAITVVISGMTASGITALSFEVFFDVIEFEV